MAKKAPKSKLQQITAKIKSNPKVAAGLAIIILLLLVVLMLVIGKEEPARTSSVLELKKAAVTKANTPEAKAKAAAEAAASPTAQPDSPAAAAAAKAKATTSSGGTSASSGSGSASSGGGSSSSGSPAVTPFSIDTPIYIEVDGDNDAYIDCNGSHEFSFTGNISASTAGTATYYWQFSDGGSTAPRSLVFSSAGTRSVNTTWNLYGNGTPGTFEGFARLVFTSPEEAASKESDGDFSLTVTCP